MAYQGLRKGRGVRTRGGSGYRGGYRGGLSRSDMNMFTLLSDQDGGVSSDESDSSDSAMLFSGDDYQEVKSRKGKRQRLSSGGRSNQDDGNIHFDTLSTGDKLSALFHKLTQVECKVDKVMPLAERVKKSENVIKSQQNRLKLLEYKSIDIESRSRRGNLIFRGIDEQPGEDGEKCAIAVRRFLRVHLKIDLDLYIERAHRLGKPRVGTTRPIIVAFRDYRDTELIMGNTWKLAGTLLSVNRDYPAEIVEARRSLYPMYKDWRDQNRYNKVSIQYPAKLIVNGQVKHDMFPDWSEVMAGYRVDSRQLYVNNDVTRNQPMGSGGTARDTSRDKNEAGDRSSRQAAGVESRGSNYVSTLTINETTLHNTPPGSTTTTTETATDDGAAETLLPMGERMQGEPAPNGGGSDDPGGDPGGGPGNPTA